MSIESRIGQLYVTSERVLDECALDNGAIIAANSDLAVYPSTAENYRFSWARDAAYQLLAAQVFNPNKAADRAIKYAGWLDNVWGFSDTGLYIKRYGTNGTLDVRYGEQYQPDQAGALIGALDTVVPERNQRIDRAIQKMADGLSGKWNGESFGATQDLWENRETNEDNGDVFTYSTASVVYGLRHAIKRLNETCDTEKWQIASDEMMSVLDNGAIKDENDNENGKPFYRRKIYPNRMYQDKDNTVDASLIGLVYPFKTFEPNDERVITTLEKIHQTLYTPNEGLHRYKGDTYDGIVRENSKEMTAGGWPLLTFWHSIALSELGEREKAVSQYYYTVSKLNASYKAKHLPENMIPEQIYKAVEKQKRGVLPLAWSHAKFALATKALRILDK